MSKVDHPFTGDMSQELIDKFLQKMRHDLLNAVRPMVEIPKWIEEDIIEEGIEIAPSLRENLDMLGTYGTRLQLIIFDLLTYVHIGRHPKIDPLPIDAAITNLITELPTGFTLTQDLQHNELPIPAQDLTTLLDALLSNSVRHHDRQGGKIHVSCKKIGTSIQFNVLDDGPGIAAKDLAKIFDPLTSMISSDQGECSGMGLAAVRLVTQLNGGRVKAISPAGKRGTCIALWFD